MPNPRPSAWALIGVLVATLLIGPASVVPVAAAPPSRAPCQQEFKDYIWANDLKPPPFVFVLRTMGPDGIKGHVEKVPFWKYVGVVVRTEYSGSGDRGPIWHRLGSLTVKQYAWYYVNVWRGAKVAFTTTNPDGTTTTTYECYHVKDTTADQLYRPIKWDSRLGPSTAPEAWIPDNQPSPNNLVGMRETWHISMRKWKATDNTSFMFLSGYRSGTALPCGNDATGFKIFQASLRDCTEANKGLTFEETVRRYFQPVYLLNTRDDDVLEDGDNYRGDLVVLAPGTSGVTAARIYPGNPTDRFGSATTRNFPINFAAVLGHGSGNVHTPRFEGTTPTESNPTATYADLFVLTTAKLWLARATGTGYAKPTSRNVTGATALAVDDYNGDLLADAGLIGPNGLRVLRSLGDGTFNADATTWWSGDLSPATRSFVGVGDFNGDGKADLVVRNAADGSYQTALSRASCTYFGARGPCPADATGAPGLGDLGSAGLTTDWAAANVKHVVGDFDRDGRDDAMAVVRDGTTIKVWGMRSVGDGTFASPLNLGAVNVSFDSFTPVAMDVSPDSMSDIALVSANSIAWLRTNEKTVNPPSTTLMPATNAGPGAGFKAF